MSGLRLALISRRFWPLVDETETALAELAEEFQRRGHQVRLVTPQWQSHWPREMFYREVPILRLPHPTTPAWGTLRYRYALSQWLKSERDTLDAVLVSQHRHDAYSATGMLAGSRAAVVLQAEGSGAGGDCDWQRTARFGLRIRRRCQQADAFIATSPAVAQELQEAAYPPHRIHTLAPGVAIPPPRSPVQRTAARLALGNVNYDLRTEPTAPVVLCAARLHDSSRLSDLISAWGPIAERWPQARLWLIGDGPAREDLFRQVCDLGLKYQIALPGGFDALEELYQAADVCVLPTDRSEGTGTLLSAMASGLPVVACDHPERREFLSHEQTGLVVPPRDTRALTIALTRLLESPTLAVQLGSRARAFAQEHHSLAPSAQRYLDLIEQTVREKRG